MNATIAGFTDADFRSLALTLIVPALGYATLYMLNIPLSKLPGVSVEHKYRVPRLLLPLVTLLLVFAVGFLSASYLTLRLHVVAPDRKAFEASYVDVIDLSGGSGMPPIRRANGDSLTFVIKRFNQYSGLRVFVNNTRVFGTHIDCVFKSQCAELPLKIPLTEHLNLPVNRVDIHLENSGVAYCGIAGEFRFSAKGQASYQTFPVDIEFDPRFGFNPEYGSYALCKGRTYLVKSEMP
jgi:hypothetical protein